MIIGAIEEANEAGVAGWIHCRTSSLKDATVLAYLDGRCVGSGKVGMFREDLRNAGLADGNLGFRFAISVPDPADALRVTVTLEGCEAMLLQPASIVTSKDAPKPITSYLGGPIPNQRQRGWMQARGWLNATQAELIESLQNFGVVSMVTESAATAVEETARALFEAVTLGPVELGVLEVKSPRQLREVLLANDGPAAEAGLFVVTADRRLSLRVVETPDCVPVPFVEDLELVGAIDHPVDQRNVLALRRWVPFGIGRTTADRVLLRAYFPLPVAPAATSAG